MVMVVMGIVVMGGTVVVVVLPVTVMVIVAVTKGMIGVWSLFTSCTTIVCVPGETLVKV